MGAEVGFERIMDGVEIDMEELIRRSDAIKAIKDHSFALGDDYMEINGYGAIDDIRALPSADRWIPCTERLPEERQDVYVTVFWDNYGDTVTAYGRRTQFGWSLWNTVEGELLKGYTVTAWMPLPEPWKGADDE